MKLANIEAVRQYGVDRPQSVELGRGAHLSSLAYFFKAGQRLGLQRPSSDTLLYIVRGRARVRISTTEDDGRAGDLFMARGDDEVWIGNSGRDELIVFAVMATD